MIYEYPGADDATAYEWLNRCTDPEKKIEAQIKSITPWEEKTVLDIGAGSGYHATWFAELADHVFALEPDPRLRRQMFDRLSRADDRRVSVLAASAEDIPLADGAVDITYARFAYFFGTPACRPGLAEVRRVLKPGGDFFIIDVTPNWGQWGELTKRAYPETFHARYHEDQLDFYSTRGFSVSHVETVFRAPNRRVVEQVFRMDFPHIWRDLIADFHTIEFSYGIAIFHLNTGH